MNSADTENKQLFYWARLSLLCGLIIGIPLLYAGTTDMHRARVSIMAAIFVLLYTIGGQAKTQIMNREGTWLRWGVFGLVASLVISSFFADRELIAWIRVVEFCLVICVANGARVLVTERQSTLMFVLLSIALSYSFSNYRLLVEWITTESPESRDWAFSIPGYYYYRGVGFAAFPALLILAWLPVSGLENRYPILKRPLGWSLIWVLLFIGWAVMAWSGTRAGFLCSAVGLFVIVWFKRSELSWGKMGLFWGTSSVSGAIASIPFTPTEGSFGLLRILGRSLNASGNANQFSSGRVEIWIDALKRMEGNWLFGIGPDQFQAQPALLSRLLEPHNLIVNALLEGGIVCLIAMLFVVAAGFVCSRRALSSPYGSISCALLVGFLVYSMLDGMLNWTLPLYIITILFGCLIGLGAEQNVIERTRFPQAFRYIGMSIGLASLTISGLVYIQGNALLYSPPEKESTLANSVYRFPATTWGISSWLIEWEERGATDLDNWYSRTIEKSPVSFFYRIQYGYYLIRRERPAEALHQLERAMVEAPRRSLNQLEAKHGQLIADLRSRSDEK